MRFSLFIIRENGSFSLSQLFHISLHQIYANDFLYWLFSSFNSVPNEFYCFPWKTHLNTVSELCFAATSTPSPIYPQDKFILKYLLRLLHYSERFDTFANISHCNVIMKKLNAIIILVEKCVLFLLRSVVVIRFTPFPFNIEFFLHYIRKCQVISATTIAPPPSPLIIITAIAPVVYSKPFCENTYYPK